MRSTRVILKYAKPHTGKFIVLFACIITTVFSGAFYPYIFGRMVDEVFYGRNMAVFINIVLIYGAVYLANQLLHFILNMTWASLMTKFLFDIRTTVFNKVLSYKGERLSDLYSGDIISRMDKDTEQFMNYIHWGIFYTAGTVLNLCMAVFFIAYMNIWIAVFTAALTPLIVYTSRFYAKKAKIYYDGIIKQEGRLSSWLFEIIKGMQDIRLLNAGRHVVSDYIGKTVKIIRLQVESGRVEIVSERVNAGITLLSRLSLYIISAVFIVSGHLTLGGFTACISYFGTCTSAFATLNKKSAAITSNMVSINRVIDLLDEESENYNANIPHIPIDRGEVCFDNVSFSYKNGVSVLDGLTLSIKAGERLSLVGQSGTGKTTLANLIYKLYEVKTGSITIDGVNINDYNLHDLRSQIGIVHQDNILFEGSVRFNISYGNDKRDDEKIWEALGQAGLEAFIRALPQQLDTVIGNNGISFSGGQKQRLVIARIFVKNPKVLIFDEATSSLDSQSESIVRAAWDDICRGRTIIVIAHRLSTIINSDKIAVLKDGKINGLGSHAELLENCPHYAGLFREQLMQNEVEADA